MWHVARRVDADGSGPISLEELKALRRCRSARAGTGPCRACTSAAGNLESGDLGAAFNEVDADGSGEMEYEEFRLMLSA